MGVDEGPFYLLSEDGVPELIQVPSVDNEDVHPVILRKFYAQRVEHAGFGCPVFLVDDLSELIDSHIRDLLGIWVLAGIVRIDRVDRSTVDDPVRFHTRCEHGRYSIGGMSWHSTSHDYNPSGSGCLRSLFDVTGHSVRHIPEGECQKLCIHSCCCDTQDVLIVSVPAKILGDPGVVPGCLATSAHDRYLDLLGSLFEHDS
jgi:hypothetical protein